MRRYLAALALLAAPAFAQPFSRVTILDLADIAGTLATDDKLFIYDTSASTLKRVELNQVCTDYLHAGELQATGDIATDACFRVGDSNADTDGDCICRDATWGLYHDTNCDATVDAGEYYLNSAPYNQYDSDRPPASCAVCDEFTDDTASLTWTWGNQDSSTVAVAYDSMKITGDTGANQEHVRATDTPSSGNADFTVTVKVNMNRVATNDGCTIGLIEQGTIASPTEITLLQAIEASATFGADTMQLATVTDYAYAGFANVGSTTSVEISVFIADAFFLQLRYTDSSRDTDAYYSYDGIHWLQVGSTATLSADPPFFYVGARDGGVCRFEWVRVRTDANRNDASE